MLKGSHDAMQFYDIIYVLQLLYLARYNFRLIWKLETENTKLKVLLARKLVVVCIEH